MYGIVYSIVCIIYLFFLFLFQVQIRLRHTLSHHGMFLLKYYLRIFNCRALILMA